MNNIGLNRHPKSNSEMFNAYNRSSINAASSTSTQAAELIMHQHVSSSGTGRHSSKPLIGTASGAITNSNSRSTASAAVAMNNAMRDSKSNNNYQNVQSP